MNKRPLKQCHKIGCYELTREKYCDNHKDQDQKQSRQRNRYYDRYDRDKEAREFYNSTEWRKVRERALRRDRYLCQQCLRDKVIKQADVVHHIIEIADDWSKRLDLSNLESICHAHHNAIHKTSI